MAAPSLTYTLTNGTTADASQVMQNFNDLLNGITDGTKDLSISALTCAGTATLNGNVAIGNASGDDLTITASLASSIPIKTTNSYDIGSADFGLRAIFMGTSDTDTAKIVSAALAADRIYQLPDAGTDADFVMTAGGQNIAGLKKFTTGYYGNTASSYTGTINQTASAGDSSPSSWTTNASGSYITSASASGGGGASSTGTLTITFATAGNYLVLVSSAYTHTASSTVAYLNIAFGGTATRYGQNARIQITQATNTDNLNLTAPLLVVATASQTLTINPVSNATYASGTHTLTNDIVIVPL